jgi:cation transport regulator ChaC
LNGAWIFGYGSLVWRPSFPYLERRPAFVRGWVRRFWQGSTDHRGRPGAPGRVVTLHREASETCWGVAYRVGPGDAGDVHEQLDVREQGGFDRCRVRIWFGDETRASQRGTVYLAPPGNPNYLGPAPAREIAEQIRASSGPSGPNTEYVLRLAEALREMGADDAHVFEIEQLLLARGAG